MEIPVSVVCTNCGNTVVFNVKTGMMGGFSAPCINCGGLVTGTYNCDEHARLRIYNVRTLGGLKKR
jgi:hypothetical protein